MEQSKAAKGSPFFCDLAALAPNERERRRELVTAVAKALRARLELPSGYALSFDQSKIDLDTLNEWSALERRCCRFLNFQVRADSRGTELILELTGSEGIKEFLCAEFSR
jgi:hypothetical protein